jgi:drug/metabolite transporter (DMT)-like permease
MVIVFALLAALSNAVNVVTQHVASATAARSSGWRLAVYLFRNPLWLSGWVALVAAFVFQALALHTGLISVVQPLLATELVFALAARRFWIRQSIRPAAWAAAGVTCAGLAVFIVAGEPQGGQATPVSRHWLTAGLACCAGAGLLAIAARWGSPGRRAALYACAAAVMWALVATFIKTTTDTLTQFGLGGMFTHWPVYALAVGSVAALLLAQAALHVGPLRVSQPFLVIIDPIVSIALSTWLFDEHFTSDAAVLAMAAIAFVVMGGGVVLLTQTAPATMEAGIRNGATQAGALIPQSRPNSPPRRPPHPAVCSLSSRGASSACGVSSVGGASRSRGPLPVSRPEIADRIAAGPDRGFTLSDTYAAAPVGMGSQKLTSRHASTPSVATLRVTPKPTSSSGAIESTTPRPPGVIGSAPATLAIP